MPLIKNKQLIANDSYVLVADDAEVPETGDLIVGLKRFLSDQATLRARGGKLGVRIDPEDEVTEAQRALATADVVALSFPKFGDGRAYSKARLFRERFAYKGELRAVGEVLADQLQYMARCGIDAFVLSEGKDVAAALRAMDDFTVMYQGDTVDPLPLYRRVTRGARAH